MSPDVGAAPADRPPHRTVPGPPAVAEQWQHGPHQPYPQACLHRLVAEQALRTPDAVAVRQWDQSMTYRDLVAGADLLAERLAARGVGVETPVVVCVNRRPYLVTAVLGVLTAGGAYVPVDPAAPAERRRMVLAEAGARVAVVDQAGRAALADSGLELVAVPESGADGAQAAPPVRPDGASAVQPDNAAYVLFTSGSTGRPKGVVISHRSVVSFCTATAVMCAVGPSTRGIAFASLTFDVSVLDMFTVLLRGGAVQLLGEEDRVDPARIQRFCAQHRVTWGFLPPALLPLLDPEGLADLTCVIVGAEPTAPEQVARWTAGGRRLVNMYGPTETTVAVTGVELSGRWDRPLPIGHPMPNHRCYVLDDQLRPVAVGQPGELYVSGIGVARGYLHRPGRTAQSFLPDPFSPTPGARMYRTGDLVVWEPDGRLGFRGRVDRQVKIAGQRLEIGEVEAALAAHPAVRQVAVDLVAGPAGPELVAYLAPRDAPDTAATRAFCADRLPPAAIPARVIRLDTLPLNSSSKVDLHALRSLAERTAAPTPAGRSAASSTQQAVAAAWAQVFGQDPPDPDADFLDSGGNSLLAMRLVAALRAGTGRDVAVTDVFAGRTPAGIAARLDRAGQAGDEPVPVDQPAALSGAQRRLWFLDRLAPESTAYNIAVAERLRGPLDVAALQRALTGLAHRHDVLRWRVSDRDGVPWVVVEPPAPVPLPVTDLSGRGDLERALAEELRREAGRRFDLAAGPLWRARLIRLGADHHVLALTLHHIVFDGWSLALLYRELSAGYRAAAGGPTAGDRAVAPVRPGYADYVAWLAARQAQHGAADLAWWLDRLAGAPTVLDLPRDHARPPVQSHRGARCQAEVPAALTAAVHRLAGELSVTPYPVMLAAFAVLLRRLTGVGDLVVGVPVADRRHSAFDDLVGFFVDTLPVRLRVDDGASFAALVGDCASAVLDAMAHRDAPFDRIVEGLRLPRDLSRGPLVQVMFNMYNFAEARLDLPGVHAEELPAGLPGSLFDLTLYVTGHGPTGPVPGAAPGDLAAPAGMALQAVYNPDLYSAARTEALLATYLALLDRLCTRPEQAVGAAPARPESVALPRPDTPRVRVARAAGGVVDRFEQVAARWPDRIAVTGAGGTLDYAAAAGLRAAVTRAVRAHGPAAGGAVGVLAGRTVTLPPVLLGVLASGRRWLVLDPAHPVGRLRAQMAAAGVALVLACVPVPDGLDGVSTLAVGDLAPDRDDRDGGARPVPATERGYLMTTSGTTGEPSIVVCPEAPLATFLDWYTDRFEIGPSDATALLAGLGHDPVLRDAFTPLVTGGRVCVPEAGWLRDPDRMLRWLASEQVTVLHLTPQLARLLAAGDTTLPGVRLAVFGGDQLTDHDVAAARAWLPDAVLVNGYGTTETPQVQSLYLVGEAGSSGSDGPRPGSAPHPVPVGRGAPGTDLVVVGVSGAPAAVGELGEVLVRGPNLADGYLDAAAAPRFGANPWTHDEEDRVYHTGDLGRHDPQGDVVLAGRADDQVKVRGHRVELGEVAAVLSSHPDVAAAVAVSRVEAGETAIVGYAVPRRSGVRADVLRDHLRQRLPEHACPSAVVLVPELPLGPNGKVDRAALPAPPVLSGPVEAGAEPSTRTERLIAGVWREVLGRPSVTVTDNFFEIGGHSLAIVAVQSRLRALLDRPVSVVDLFRFPNIRALAGYLDGANRGAGLDRADRRLAAMRQARRPAAGRVPHPSARPEPR